MASGIEFTFLTPVAMSSIFAAVAFVHSSTYSVPLCIPVDFNHCNKITLTDRSATSLPTSFASFLSIPFSIPAPIFSVSNSKAAVPPALIADTIILRSVFLLTSSYF